MGRIHSMMKSVERKEITGQEAFELYGHLWLSR